MSPEISKREENYDVTEWNFIILRSDKVKDKRLQFEENAF